jgi:serine/threonine protein kinase
MAFPSRTEIVTAFKNPLVCYKAKELIGGNIFYNKINVIQFAGGYTTVFPFKDKTGKKVAVRCWCADIGDAKKRSSAISDYLCKEQNQYFINFRYVENAILINGELQPVIIMDWVEGKTLKEYLSDNCDSKTFYAIAEEFKMMVADFHKRGIAHGDLQHGNILVKSDGTLVVVDYDSMYIDNLKGMYDVIKGLPGYQHPARVQNQYVQPNLDYFSELVIYLSLLIFAENPKLWLNYCDAEDLLFSKEDFSNIKQSTIYKQFQKSSNSEIANLLKKLEEELAKSDIQELLPLEDLLIDKLQKSFDDISKKWDVQPNQPQPKVFKIPEVKSLTDKF